MRKIHYEALAAAAVIVCLMAACSGKTYSGGNTYSESGQKSSASKQIDVDHSDAYASAEEKKENAETAVSPDEEKTEAEEISEHGDSEGNPEGNPEDVPAEAVIFGDEREEEYLPLLEGKRVALFSNQSGIVGNRVLNEEETEQGDFSAPEEQAAAAEGLVPFGKLADGTDAVYGEHILDALVRQGVDVEVVFSPEHGFRGAADAGEQVADSVDEQTGVPVRSLYGRGSKGPAEEDKELFDVLVVDIQDVGLRYYTYYITMYYLMDACAAAEKEVVILDRPNPNGFYMDGPVLEEEFVSGVGKLPVPVAHGMTLGELAQMINGEGWLTSGKDACALTVIPCENYTHATKASLVTRPSPNLKDMRAVYLYASTCFFENTAFSVGRGTEFPFEAYGSPYLAENPDSEENPDPEGSLEQDEQEDSGDKTGFSFTPVSMDGATSPPFEGQVCFGRDLRTIPLAQILQEGINLEYVIDAWSALQKTRPDISFFGTPDDSGRYWIDKLCGTGRVRHMIEEGCSAEEIKASWQEKLEAFREQRRPYLLYKE